MRCSSCCKENREGARFCDGCGATLEAVSEWLVFRAGWEAKAATA